MKNLSFLLIHVLEVNKRIHFDLPQVIENLNKSIKNLVISTKNKYNIHK